LIREREHGTVEHLLVMPVRRIEIMLAKLWSMASVVLLATTPRESIPWLLRELMLLAPTTHFVELSQAILFRGAGLDVVWRPFLALLGIGGLLFGASLARFGRAMRMD
jgi:ABC-type Na+ efflux pump permease subunit